MANWDSEIDDVAREMTEAGADAGLDDGFQARVLARIDAVDRRGWRLPAVRAWSPVAAAAALVLALVILRSPWQTADPLKPDVGSASSARSGTVQPPSDTTIANQARPRIPDALTGTAADRPGTNREASRIREDVEAARTAARITNRPALEAAAQTAAALAGTERADPLASAPLEVVPLGVDAVEAMESIDVPAFGVAALAVPPAAAIAELEVPAIGAQ